MRILKLILVSLIFALPVFAWPWSDPDVPVRIEYRSAIVAEAGIVVQITNTGKDSLVTRVQQVRKGKVVREYEDVVIKPGSTHEFGWFQDFTWKVGDYVRVESNGYSAVSVRYGRPE